MRALLAALAIVAAAAPAAAQPMDTYGMGSRSIALGGAVTADVEDFSANFYNPAGVVRSETLHFGIGWFWAEHDLSINDRDSNVDPVSGVVAGLNVPGNIGDFRFAFSLGLHLNDQRVSRTRTLPRMRPRWELYDNRQHRTFLAAHVAIEPVPWLRVGGGIGFLSFSEVDLRIRGELSLASPERESRLESDLLANLVTIRFPQAGVQVQPLPWLNFGAVYRGEYVLTSELFAQVGEPDGDGPLATSIRAGSIDVPTYLRLLSASTGAYVPHQISFGASVEPIPEVLRIGVEVTWLMWSLYQSPIGRTELDLEIDVPPELAGTITVPPLADTFPAPANFSDRWVPRIGVEVTPLRDDVLALDLRAGYFYENSPAPEQTNEFNLVDTDRHAWSVGVGVEFFSLRPFLPGSLTLDVHFQYAFMPSRLNRKLSPIDPTGDYVARGNIFVGGFTLGLQFE